MSSSTVQNVSEVLETIFEMGEQSMLFEAAPLMGLIPKDTNFKGKNRAVTLRYTPEPGGSATFATAVANKGPSKYKQFTVTRSPDYVVSSLSTELYRAAKGGGEGALVDALTSVVNGMKNTGKRSLCRSIYGNGGGARAQVASGMASSTITLVNPDDIVFFEAGMQLDGSAADGTSGAVTAGGANSFIVSIDRDAGTITNSGAANWNAATGINGLSANWYLFRGGDFGGVFPGVGGWIPSTVTATSFFGVDRTTDSERLAGCRLSSASATVEATILDLLKRVYRAGGAPDYVFLSPEKFNKLVKELGSKRTYADVRSTDASVGYRALVIEGQGGPAKVLSDPNCPSDTIFALTMDTWKFATLGAPMSLIDEDGKMMVREAGADAMELRLVTYGAVICDAPAFNGRAPAPLRERMRRPSASSWCRGLSPTTPSASGESNGQHLQTSQQQAGIRPDLRRLPSERRQRVQQQLQHQHPVRRRDDHAGRRGEVHHRAPLRWSIHPRHQAELPPQRDPREHPRHHGHRCPHGEHQRHLVPGAVHREQPGG